VDERLTTAQANKMLIGADRKSKERKQVVDKVAAALILQTFLDMGAEAGD
jgi:putative Holliday junction resolvase